MRRVGTSGGRWSSWPTIAFAGIVLVAACSDRSADESATTTAEPTTAPATTQRAPTEAELAALAALADVAGRLVVLGHEWELTLVDPDGGNPVVVATTDERIEERTQPTWAPDGSAFAWTERDVDGRAELVVADRDGSITSRTEVPFVGGYLAWSPTASNIAVMGNDRDGRMRLAMATPGVGAEPFDAGFPMYIDWLDDGSALLVHVDDRFELATLDGDRTDIETDGEFRVGLQVGDAILYGVEDDVGEILVLRSGDGSARELLRYAAPTAIVVAPDEERLAILARGSPQSAAVLAVDDDLVALAPSRLEIVDLATGTLTTVAEVPAVAWFWSPDGTRLLYSAPVVEDGQTMVAWSVYEDGASMPLSSFIPSAVFGRRYLAFFDQLVRSVTFWSPDSTAFAYAGGRLRESVDELGALGLGPADGRRLQSGIWVQLVGDHEPARIADGQVAVWSPT